MGRFVFAVATDNYFLKDNNKETWTRDWKEAFLFGSVEGAKKIVDSDSRYTSCVVLRIDVTTEEMVVC